MIKIFVEYFPTSYDMLIWIDETFGEAIVNVEEVRDRRSILIGYHVSLKKEEK